MIKVYFAENLRYLINKQGVKHSDVANLIGNNVQSITDYLASRSRPKFDGLIAIADFFGVSLDDLVYKNLQANDIEVDGVHISIDRQKNILVPVKAQAGYVAEWTQSKYGSLEQVHIPGVYGEARTWEIEGNSMEPLLFGGDFVSGTKSSLNTLTSGGIYVVVTVSQGIHIKFVDWHEQGILLTPANHQHKPYVLPLSELREVWNVQTRITRRILSPTVYRNPNAGSEWQFPVVRVERGEDPK